MTCPPVNSSLSVLDNSGAIVPTARIHFRDVNYPRGRRTGPIGQLLDVRAETEDERRCSRPCQATSGWLYFQLLWQLIQVQK